MQDAASPRARSGAQLRLTLATPPALGLQDFVEAPSNAEACERLGEWRRWPGGALALVGPAGVGKSHLASLWARHVGAALLAPGEAGEAAPVLAEDVDRRMEEPEFEEALFHAVNRAARGGAPLLVTARALPAEIACVMPDLRSRLNALAVAVVGEPEDALLRRLLLKFFRERSVRPSEDLLTYLVRRMDRSAEGARAVVEALDRACRAGERLGRPLARTLLEDADALGWRDGPSQGGG